MSISDRRRGFFIVYNDVLDTYGKELGSSAVAVYAALCRFANRDSGETFVGQERIGTSVGLSSRAVRDALDKLEAAGLIVVSKSGKHNSNLYSIQDIPEISSGSYRKNLPTNKTNRTISNEADASGENPRQPLPVAGSQPNPLAEEYERLKSNGSGLREIAVGLVRYAQQQPNNNRLIAGALGRVYVLCFGDRIPPNFPRLMRMSQRAGGPERLATRMLDVAAREVLGNPHDVLEKWRPAWQDRKENENKTNEVSRTWGSWQPQNDD